MLLNPVDEIDQLVICLKKKSDRRNNKTHIVNGSRRLAVSFGKQNGWSKEVNGSRTSTLTHGYTAVGSREEYQTLSLLFIPRRGGHKTHNEFKRITRIECVMYVVLGP